MEKIQFKDLPDMTTPLSSANLNQMQDNMEDAIVPIKLVSISDTTPASATIGDMYYNTTDNKIYTATAENTWDSGSTPRYDGFYINTNDNTLFYYDGNTLILSGGNLTDKNIKNEETTSETDVYSCNYINSIQTLYETVLDGDSNTIIINNLNIKPGTSFQIIIDGTTTSSSGEIVNIGCYPNDKSAYDICRVVGIENNASNINSIYNTNTSNMYMGRVVRGNQFIINSYCSWLGTYLKNLSSYATPGINNIFIAGNLCSMVNLSDETLTSIRIVIASGQFVTGTKVSILR